MSKFQSRHSYHLLLLLLLGTKINLPVVQERMLWLICERNSIRQPCSTYTILFPTNCPSFKADKQITFYYFFSFRYVLKSIYHLLSEKGWMLWLISKLYIPSTLNTEYLLTVAHTIDCVCNTISNHGFKIMVIIFNVLGWKNILN